ncbi:MAG: hypothetical protein KDD69_05920 [Bdellovibrionales bacterium]|nr:hypothetical protein [Bdellovibrionales bacterium]
MTRTSLSVQLLKPNYALLLGYMLYLQNRGEREAEAQGDCNGNTTLRVATRTIDWFRTFVGEFDSLSIEGVYLAKLEQAALCFAEALARRHRHFLSDQKDAERRRNERIDQDSIADLKGLVWAWMGQLLAVFLTAFSATFAFLRETVGLSNDTLSSVLISLAVAGSGVLWTIGKQIGSIGSNRRSANDAYHAAIARARTAQTQAIRAEAETAMSIANDAWSELTDQPLPDGLEYATALYRLLDFDIQQANLPETTVLPAVQLIRAWRLVRRELWPPRVESATTL